ncbi:hypothetical protein [Limnoglobus roseus]|uniref:Uncharacterized protein n=1 Tax=Limnoglobus roseus TaxID=2598579 RepID=A0A5C1AJB3_9BACT|nr:hypothetical protein [Limnoglobus roseus]QEL18257.1 hypothetical protein PX52LOC_05275 [Limnoglobus roseus]
MKSLLPRLFAAALAAGAVLYVTRAYAEYGQFSRELQVNDAEGESLDYRTRARYLEVSERLRQRAAADVNQQVVAVRTER